MTVGVSLWNQSQGGLPATRSLVERMTTQPSATDQALYNEFFAALERAGISDAFDFGKLYAAHDAQAATLNLFGSSFTGTQVNSPTFITNRGFQGDAFSKYLDTGYNPSVNASKYGLNNNSMAVFVLDNTATNSGAMGASRSRITPRAAAGTVVMRSNNASSATFGSTASSVGFWAYSRTSSTNIDAYKNGAFISSASNTVSGYDTVNLRILADDTAFYGGTVAAAFVGAELTATQHLALYNAVAAFLTGKGAI